MPPYILQRQTYACQAFPMEHIMKQHNAYKKVDHKANNGFEDPTIPKVPYTPNQKHAPHIL